MGYEGIEWVGFVAWERGGWLLQGLLIVTVVLLDINLHFSFLRNIRLRITSQRKNLHLCWSFRI